MTDEKDLVVQEKQAPVPPEEAEKILKLIATADIGALTPSQQLMYVKMLCENFGLNPWTRPFEFLTLNNKRVLYIRKDATDQLRRNKGVNIQIMDRLLDKESGIFVVRARATMPDGREDESLGAVGIKGQEGSELANSMMKAETKAKRRVTLSILGLGLMDESEVVDIPNQGKVGPGRAKRITPPPIDAQTIRTPDGEVVSTETGEVLDSGVQEAEIVSTPQPTGPSRLRTAGQPKPMPPSVAPVEIK